LLLPDMLFSTGEGAVVGLLQLYFFLKFGINVGVVGLIFTGAGLIGGFTALSAPRFVRRFGQLSIATTMQYLSAPVMLLIGFSPLLPLAIAAEFARRILRGLFDPTYAAFAMERVSSRHRATLSGFYSVTWSIGFSIGPSIAGFFQDRISLSAAFVIGAALLALSATLLRVFFGTGKDAPILR
ncbi:MAG: MFS transporter, partial [Ktedonobacterales bacterium]